MVVEVDDEVREVGGCEEGDGEVDGCGVEGVTGRWV